MQRLNIGPAIIRVASWPVETLAEIHSPHFTECVDSWLDLEEKIHRGAAQLSKILYTLIPNIQDRFLRSVMLSFRRHIYRSVDPIPSLLIQPLMSSDVIPSEIKELISYQSKARNSLKDQERSLQSEYARSLQAELAEIHQITSSLDFQKALYLASPTTFEALKKTKKRNEIRQPKKLDFTIYSYLMRAIGRAAPNSLWSGVAIETKSNETETPVSAKWTPPGQILFNPNLLPFFKAFHAITSHAEWLKNMHCSLNPTLFQRDAETWQFGTYREGIWHTFLLANHSVLPVLISIYSNVSSILFQEVRDNLQFRGVVQTQAEAEELVSRLLEIGVLWPAVKAPNIYDNPWHALDKIIQNLPTTEKYHWESCVHDLKTICMELNSHYWTMSLEELKSYMIMAKKRINDLIAMYDLPAISEATHALLGDLLAPFNFSISPPRAM